jgi:hypothetical protein
MASTTNAEELPGDNENQWRPIGEAVGAGDVPVEVIESLCMECHEQVRFLFHSSSSWMFPLMRASRRGGRAGRAGRDPYALDCHPLLQGGYCR